MLRSKGIQKQPPKERRISFMANNKIDRINKEIAKTREKITEYQNKLKGLEAQKTEAENLEIVQLVRAMRMTPQELNAMLSGGGIPGMSAAPASDEAADYEEQEDNADEE
jgi:wobble nucleotide-excising tRNase